MIYLYWVAVFTVIALALAVRFDRRLEVTFAPALFGGILVMYLFGLAGPLLWSLAAISLLGAASGVYLIVQAVRRKDLFLRLVYPRRAGAGGDGALYRLDAGRAAGHRQR